MVLLSDEEVIICLRALREPKTLFGELESHRRARLLDILKDLPSSDRETLIQGVQNGRVQNIPSVDQQFTVSGPEELKQARQHLINYFARFEPLSLPALTEQIEIENRFVGAVPELQIMPMSRSIQGICCIPSWFDCDSKFLVSGHSGEVGLVDFEENFLKLGDHDGYRATFVTSFCSHGPALCVSTGFDGNAIIWGQSHEVGALQKFYHGDYRVSSALPVDNFLFTSCHDATWRLWDIETGFCLQTQEGHGLGIHSMALGNHGLLATGGLDGAVLLWDSRAGSLLNASAAFSRRESHRKVTSLSFSQNGWLLAAARGDGTIEIQDIRMSKVYRTLYAHSRVVSGVQFSPSSSILLSTGFDGTVRLWDPLRGLVKCIWDLQPTRCLFNAAVNWDAGNFAVPATDRTVTIFGLD